jgi:tetratricopeptide (TPR) repeat protein
MEALKVRDLALVFLLLVPVTARAQDAAFAPLDLKIEMFDRKPITEQPSSKGPGERAQSDCDPLSDDPSLSGSDKGRKRLERAQSRFKVGQLDNAFDDAQVCLIQDPLSASARRISTICKAAIALRDKTSDKRALLEAAAQVAQFLTSNPDDPLARGFRGALLCHLDGNITQAIADLTFAIDADADVQARRLGISLTGYRAWAFMVTGEYERAIADCDVAASQCRFGAVDASILDCRGRCRAACGQYDLAIADFSGALEQDSRMPSPKYLYRRARAYRQQRDFPRALEDLDKIALLTPNDPQVYLNRAMLFWDMGENERAIREMDHLVSIFPECAQVYFMRAVTAILVLNDWNRAMADVDRAIAIEPRFAPFYALRAFLHAREMRLIPTCKDLSLCAITRDQTEYEFDWRIDARRHKFAFSFLCWLKSQPQAPHKELADRVEEQCVREGMSRLLAALLGSRSS